MEELVRLVQALEASEIEPRPYLRTEDHPNVARIEALLDTLLITPRGNINLDARDELRDHGYEVYPVECDGFGWLIGGLATKKGTIAFG